MKVFSDVQNSIASSTEVFPNIILQKCMTACTKGLLEGLGVLSRMVMNSWLRCSLQALKLRRDR